MLYADKKSDQIEVRGVEYAVEITEVADGVFYGEVPSIRGALVECFSYADTLASLRNVSLNCLEHQEKLQCKQESHKTKSAKSSLSTAYW